MQKINIGIAGFGNLGRGVYQALSLCEDMQLKGIFSRRTIQDDTVNAPFYAWDTIKDHQKDIDVMILCGGSATDLPEQTPELAQYFSTVDSFDTHACIPEYFDAVNQAAEKGGHIALVSIGWDPGLFSIARMMGGTILPNGTTHTFWGKGLSQGHSDALRRIEGVKFAVQYTVPDEAAIEAVRQGRAEDVNAQSAHLRDCYVVLHEGADAKAIEQTIKTMPHYFAGYTTEVHFIDEATFKRDHNRMPHGGMVMHSANTPDNEHHVMEYRLTLGSNPAFTASVLVAYARAAYVMKKMGMTGAKTVFDVAPAWLSAKDPALLRRDLL